MSNKFVLIKSISRSLDVGKCEITDSGLRLLAARLPRLRKLSLRGCARVGDGGVAAVAQSCSGLVHLNLADCPAVSVPLLRLLAQNLRHCWLEHSEDGGDEDRR